MAERTKDSVVRGSQRVKNALRILATASALAGCTPEPIQPPIGSTDIPGSTNPAFTETVPAIETPSPTEFQPTATDVYRFGSGGPISREQLAQMEQEDPTVVKQIDWLNTWGDWYGSADPSIRPMVASEARNNIVFYQWAGGDGSVHYKAAWKFDQGYPGFILVPPAINWQELNPPVAASAGHEIGPGQGPVMISIQCTEGSDLAKMGVPVGAQMAPEAGTGDWVMVSADTVVARVNAKGVWELAEKPAAKDVWQVSPDGHIAYNEAQLYGGLFTIDKAHPENTQKYWEDSIRGLWNLQFITKGSKHENTAFLAQFPTAEKLLDWINAGNPVNNLWIPVKYPSSQQQFEQGAILVPTKNPVDLSKIALAIYKPTIDEMEHYNANYASGNTYISFYRSQGEALVEEINEDGRNILKFSLRRELLADYANPKNPSQKILALLDTKSPAENFLAAAQMLKVWVKCLDTQDIEAGKAYDDAFKPPLLFLQAPFSSSETSTDGSPLALR